MGDGWGRPLQGKFLTKFTDASAVSMSLKRVSFQIDRKSMLKINYGCDQAKQNYDTEVKDL